MTRTGLLAMVAAATLQVSQPDLGPQLAKCAVLKGSVERLDCYDALARAWAGGSSSIPAPTKPRHPGDSGKWTIDITKNVMDDSQTVVMVLPADGLKATLILRCKQGEPEVYINWADYLGSEATPVLTRLGEAKAETKRWSLSTDHRATFYPGDDAAFIRQLLSVERLVAQVTPYSESPVTAVFDLRGLGNAIAPLKAVCKIEQ